MPNKVQPLGAANMALNTVSPTCRSGLIISGSSVTSLSALTIFFLYCLSVSASTICRKTTGAGRVSDKGSVSLFALHCDTDADQKEVGESDRLM